MGKGRGEERREGEKSIGREEKGKIKYYTAIINEDGPLASFTLLTLATMNY